MASVLEAELHTAFDYALTALELDQSGARSLEAYHAAASQMRYISNMLIDGQDPLLWSEACRQIQGALEGRIQVLARREPCMTLLRSLCAHNMALTY